MKSVCEVGEHYQAVKINSTQAAIQWAKDSLGSYFDERLKCFDGEPTNIAFLKF